MRANDQMKQPFFVKFLEGQRTEAAGKDQAGELNSHTGAIADDPVTLKFPSDDDEWVTL